MYRTDILLLSFSPDLNTLGHACRNDPRLEPGMALNMSSSYYFYDWETAVKRKWMRKLIFMGVYFGLVLILIVACIIHYVFTPRKKQRQSLVPASSHHDVEHITASEASTVVGSSPSRPQSMVTVRCDTLEPKVKNERKVLHKVFKGGV